MSNWISEEGAITPLGAAWVPEAGAYNFVLFSKHATQVTLLLYAEDNPVHPVREVEFDPLKHKSGPLWHCRILLAEVPSSKFYAYRVDGPAGSGHAFDRQKILLDPFAKAVYFPPEFRRQAACEPGSNAGQAPLGVLPDPDETPFNWGEPFTKRHESDLIIYELHVRGFTQHVSSQVAAEKRGTFAGLVEKIPYLKELGITAVELMPVFQFDPEEGNYWGYSPLSFFAPHNGFSVSGETCSQCHEFRAMVQAVHQAGIEVLLDVVYNHTGEGDHRGPTYSWKGLDNTVAYLMTDDPQTPYANFSGTGNTVHSANLAMQWLIVSSLEYWRTEMRVDGFRFDLASIFTRDSQGNVRQDNVPIFGQIAGSDPLEEARLIAEPWDAGGAYHLGQGFPGLLWRQWNGRFRDTLQRFVRGDKSCVGDLMLRLYGSDDLFPDDPYHAYHPFQSINYVTSHDGMTLYDLVSYNQKRNWANGHHNTDGPNDLSWNCGWEGDDNLPDEVLRLRKRQIKNFFCLLMLANGTPMFRMGDEFLQTQGGNNNPYNQDNETSWLNWQRLDQHRDIFRFFQQLIAFRKAHPSLSRSRFWRDDVKWHGTERQVDLSENSRTLAYFLNGRSQKDQDLYVMINADAEDRHFGLHARGGNSWKRVIDTSRPSPDDVTNPGQEVALTDAAYDVRARSIVVLMRE